MARLVIEVSGKNAEAALKSLTKEAEKLGGSAKRLDPALKKNEDSLRRNAAASKKLASSVKSLAATYLGTAGLIFALKGATRAAIEQAQAEAQLAQGIKSTGGIAGQTASELTKMATGLQQVTTFSDEAIIRAQSIILTFTKIRDETFPATTKAVLDLAARMGNDLPAAAVQLGKALNDPVANLGELGRAGIQFTKAQKEVIKAHFEGGEAAKAQALILEELTRQFGGSAEAAAKAAGGGYKKAGNALSDISEGIGGAFLPTLDSMGHALASQGSNLKAFAGVLTKLIVPGLAATLFGLEEVEDGADSLGGKLKSQTLAFDDMSGAVNEAGMELAAFVHFQDLAKQRLEAVNESIKTLTDTVEDMRQRSEDASDSIREQWRMEDQIAALDAAFEQVSFDQVVKNADLAANDIAEEFKGALDSLGDGGPGVSEAGAQAGEEFGEEFGLTVALLLVDAIQNQDWKSIGASIGSIVGSFYGPGGAAAGGAIGGILGGLVTDNSGPSALHESLEKLNDSMRAFAQSVQPGAVNAIEDLFLEIREQTQEVNRVFKESGGQIDNFAITFEIAMRKIEQAVNDILGISTQLADRLQAAIELNKQLGFGPKELGGGLGGGTGGGPGGGDGSEQEALEALGAVTAASKEFITTLGENTRAYGEAIDLGKLAAQLAFEFAGVSFEFQSVAATGNLLRETIATLGLTAEETARLIQFVTEAEGIRMAQLENDVLQRLVNVLGQIPGMQEEAARLQSEINQAKFQIEVQIIKIQLEAMGLMTEAFAQMLNVATAFGEVLSNFVVPIIGSIGGFDFKPGKFKPGKFKGPKGKSAAEIQAEEDARDRERLLETLEGLATTPAFNSLNDRLLELRQNFFGPGGFSDEAKRLGLDMALVTKAFRHQRQLLMDEANRGIREFLAGLGASSFNPGGIGAQFGSAQSSFNDLLARAQGGDLDARAELAGSAQQLLDLARQRYGNTRRYQNIFEQVQGSLGDLLGNGNVTVDGRKIALAEEQVRLLSIIAGESNVTPFEKSNRELVSEMRLLRSENSATNATLTRERARIAELERLQREKIVTAVEGQTKPTLSRKSGTGRM